MNKLSKLHILGVGITTASKDEVLEYIFEKLLHGNEKLKIYTPNPEILVYGNSNNKFRKILNEADIAIPDGIGLIIASKILNKPLKEKISGIDLMLEICRKSKDLPVRIGLLGARSGVAEKAADCLRKQYPGINIIFAASEWPESIEDIEKKVKIYDLRFKKEFLNIINHKSSYINSEIDFLFVAYGAPKQEEWIAENLEKLPVRAMMGVGGSFDIISGDIKRAPRIIRKIGFEWLYRLTREPWRWKRQLNLLKFLLLILKEKYSTR